MVRYFIDGSEVSRKKFLKVSGISESMIDDVDSWRVDEWMFFIGYKTFIVRREKDPPYDSGDEYFRRYLR